MIIGHIGARKGSKGVPNKNFREICGKPLILWTLEQLEKNPKVDEIIVSTDDQRIYDFCTQRGTLDVGLRPLDLSTDDASKWDVWRHSLSVAEERFDDVEVFLDLDCTSPLRRSIDINRALDLFSQEKPDMVMSCCEARKNPYFNLVEFNDDQSLKLSKPLDNRIVSRQQAPEVLEHAASIYVINPNYLKESSFLYDGRAIPVILDPKYCIDIDNEIDFKIVEFLLRESLNEH